MNSYARHMKFLFGVFVQQSLLETFTPSLWPSGMRNFSNLESTRNYFNTRIREEKSKIEVKVVFGKVIFSLPQASQGCYL